MSSNIHSFLIYDKGGLWKGGEGPQGDRGQLAETGQGKEWPVHGAAGGAGQHECCGAADGEVDRAEVGPGDAAAGVGGEAGRGGVAGVGAAEAREEAGGGRCAGEEGERGGGRSAEEGRVWQ